jgi:hypothetical protein
MNADSVGIRNRRRARRTISIIISTGYIRRLRGRGRRKELGGSDVGIKGIAEREIVVLSSCKIGLSMDRSFSIFLIEGS